MALPRKSISGLPVIECAGFGRDVISLNKSEKDIKIKIGYLFHMHCMEKNKLIGFNKKNLASHTFITGSTGSGKSNTVYQLLSEITKSDARFLVIEPAKGEYKNIFGNLDGVFVYGTNPELSPLLKINPFKFPTGNSEPKKNIHILEHLDRLIEIFNVCWPMYAAMPAVLKNAVEKSYEEAGWDLKKSKNKYNFELYPSFVDIIQNVKRIIDSSEYSDENKGNYKGSLITRLESLTNGLNSLIFVNDELSNTDLFDKNVIVDLSRIGSMETKALIMGLLVMKLQEYRMTSGKTNADLNHVTVLEEAHNLLKRTSTEQSSESANLLGKSVEMLANAIAEMRTYGEGFIIADQSPGLLDMSVIRNTNTKIILRLPDASDRELVGKAANLNEDQIIEISRFPLGVAAIYQNDWIEPVLCKVEEFKDKKPYHFENKDLDKLDDLEKLKTDITSYLLSNITNDPVDKDIDALKERIYKSNLSTGLKLDIIDYITKHYPPKELADIYGIISEIYKPSYKFIEKYAKAKDINNRWAKQLLNEIEPSIIDFNGNIQRLILCTIFYKLYRQNVVSLEFYKKWENYYLQR
jgi:DNA helicase HerA-like ATPase